MHYQITIKFGLLRVLISLSLWKYFNGILLWQFWHMPFNSRNQLKTNGKSTSRCCRRNIDTLHLNMTCRTHIASCHMKLRWVYYRTIASINYTGSCSRKTSLRGLLSGMSRDHYCDALRCVVQLHWALIEERVRCLAAPSCSRRQIVIA